MSNHDELKFSPLEVKVTGSFEDASRRFRSIVQKEGVLAKVKEKAEYEKPSQKRRRKEREAANRRFVEDLREQQMKTGEWDKIMERREKKKQEKMARRQQLREQNNE